MDIFLFICYWAFSQEDFNFSLLSLNRSYQCNRRIVCSHFANQTTWDNRGMFAETRLHIQFSLSSTSSLLKLPDIWREASVSNLHNLSTDFESTISNSQLSTSIMSGIDV